ncbi:hypothetical protein BGP77_01570 [Saccharospirillum sp. MSK14-1]|nr:hypothetical protein BGP77_01570 [Saccharospirillum sp. MSK14-1]
MNGINHNNNKTVVSQVGFGVLLISASLAIAAASVYWPGTPWPGVAAGVLALAFWKLPRRRQNAVARSADWSVDDEASPAQIGQAASRIAIESADASHFLDGIQKHLVEQQRVAGALAERVEGLEGAAQGMSGAMDDANARVDDAQSLALDGQERMTLVEQARAGQRDQLNACQQQIDRLQEESAAIGDILGTIHKVADQTNLLALNAAIEAARAGDHGRGFAVVADEVRQLARQTADATDTIGRLLGGMSECTDQTKTAMDALLSVDAELDEALNGIGERLSGVADGMTQARDTVHAMADLQTAVSKDSQGISSDIEHLHGSMKSIEHSIGEASSRILALSERVEGIFVQLRHYDIDDRHTQLARAAVNAAADIGAVLESAIEAGHISEDDLFRFEYTPIDGTDPIKHKSPFDDLTDQLFPPIQEPVLDENDDAIYAGAVDVNGYFPTHNNKFCQPLTGDYDTDVAGNRTKRIFTDRTGKRCGSHEEPFLLQTYKRDTGEVMHDVSAPIYVAGKHWGGFRIGYKSD